MNVYSGDRQDVSAIQITGLGTIAADQTYIGCIKYLREVICGHIPDAAVARALYVTAVDHIPDSNPIT